VGRQALCADRIKRGGETVGAVPAGNDDRDFHGVLSGQGTLAVVPGAPVWGSILAGLRREGLSARDFEILSASGR